MRSIFNAIIKKRGPTMLYGVLFAIALILGSGKIAHASTLYFQPVDSFSETGSPGPYYSGQVTSSAWPTASQTVTDIWIEFSSTGSTFWDFQSCDTSGGGTAHVIVGFGNTGGVRTIVHVSGLSINANWNSCATEYFYTSTGSLTVWGASHGSPYVLMTDSGGVTPDNTATRFISISPASGTTTATTTTVGAHVFVNPNDYVDGMYLSMSFTNQTVVNTGGSALDAWNSAFHTGSTGGDPAIHIPITASSTDLDLSTTTTFAFGGTTFGTYQLVKPDCYFFCLFNSSSVLIASSTTFVIGQRTALDVALEAGGESLVNALLTGTTTQPVLQCGAFSSNFSLETCLISIIIPPQSAIVQDFQDLYNGFATRFPFGYLTRFIVILTNNGTSTTALPSATVTFQTASDATSSLTFNFDDMITGGGALMNSIQDPNSGKNMQQIIEPWIQLFIALSIVIIIVSDLAVGIGRRH